MLESIIVVATVAIVAVMAGRSFYRTVTGKDNGCGYNCRSCACNGYAEAYPGQDVDRLQPD